MKRFLAAACALAAVCLTACGASGGGTVKEGLYYDASGICPDAVLLTVNGQDVAAQRYFYWLTYTCDYAAQALGDGLDWSEERESGTLADYVKEEALRRTALYAVVEQWARQAGCGLTAEDQTAIDGQFAANAQQYGGEEQYLTRLASMGLDRESADSLSADYYLYGHLKEAYPTSSLCPEGSSLEEYKARCATVSWCAVPAAAGKSARARADEIAASVNGGRPFAEATAALGGESAQSVTLTPEDALCAQAAAIAEGSCGAAETAEGVFVLLRQPLEESAAAGAFFDEALSRAAEEAEITYADTWDTIDAASYYEKVTALREKL
ncbi:hypothetical protein KQI82_01335 [Oscillibacter sp. MSJ-2]|uniref:Uncharacterized protein n=1 Tax=Dysosmobacter acutus TaxID=2841504 RepID=A0ABS6F5L6_9FIRM|nr:hypothetical protein [Dysosmobacter acutus]MBU5625575.1 hypothetical protein [Dysosmobacter acutus]